MSDRTDYALNTSTDTCPICGGIGLVTLDVPVGHPDFGRAFPCICQKDNFRAREIARLRTMGNLDAYIDKTFDTFEVDFTLLEGEESYLRRVFREMSAGRKISLTEAQRRAVNIAAQTALAYAESPTAPFKWLLLEGNYGTGKTHLAAAIANRRIEYSDPVLFITAPDLLDYLRSTFGPSSEIAYDDLFDRVRKAPLLVLDDLGAENQTGWAAEKLYQIFNDRHRFELPTVVTTNRDVTQIEPRIRSRLLDQELTRSVKLMIPDRRSPVATWQEIDLTNLDRYAEMTFDRLDLRSDEGLPEADLRRFAETVKAAQAFAAAPEGWLVLTGRPGSGKTHLAAAIAHESNRRGGRTLFVTAADLLNHLRATFYPGSAVGYDKRMEEIKGADILVLDDLTIDEKGMSSWARDKLYEILIYRFDYIRPTVITTAQTLQDMDARLRSRVTNASRSTVEAITVPSYPGKTLRRRAAPPRRAR
jgi:DNA replication protein DnaC